MRRVRGILHREMEAHQHGVVLKLRDDTAVLTDRLRDGCEVRVEHCNHLFGLKSLGERREALDVGVEDGRLPDLRTQSSLEQCTGNALVDELSERAAQKLPLLATLTHALEVVDEGFDVFW